MRGLMAAIAIGCVAACGNSQAQPAGDLAQFEARVAALERQVAECRDDDALVRRLDKVLWKTRITATAGKTEQHMIQELLRLNGLVDALGGARVRGWWCGRGGCGRTRKECVDSSRRTIALSGPDADGSECARLAAAWCPDEERLDCEPAPCANCTRVE